jgi:hypothetical protein
MERTDEFVAHSLRTSMFFPQTRLMVAGNPKAAGTTLRWWLLAAHGVDVADRTRPSWWGESAPYQTVWDETTRLEYIWPQLSEEARKDALSASDVVTVHPVRNPVSRLFSAWSGKYLVNEPYYEDRLPAEFPHLPATFSDVEQIVAAFADFTKALRQVVSDRGFETIDVHLWPQHRLLARQPAGRILLLRQESMEEGLEEIAAMLRAQGVEPGPAPRINETVVPYRAELVSDAALADVVTLYEADFARWGYEHARPDGSSRAVDLPWLNDVRGRNVRYGVLHRALMHQQHEGERLAREIAAARQREGELMDSTSWKVTGPLRWVGDRTKR